ncbi:hypothetical protein DFP72DRAFT_63534 [Ephemerocybe angulata]|uniref:Uncharacterized protein n=1 Tax=Ephemerocybe angulata TaxID=980116 RepID=A0A8H6LUW6_9AGAR|nr:hypothetical protein DFP72DRAFT_63534 [Tulosesus angulatus]
MAPCSLSPCPYRRCRTRFLPPIGRIWVQGSLCLLVPPCVDCIRMYICGLSILHYARRHTPSTLPDAVACASTVLPNSRRRSGAKSNAGEREWKQTRTGSGVDT